MKQCCRSVVQTARALGVFAAVIAGACGGAGDSDPDGDLDAGAGNRAEETESQSAQAGGAVGADVGEVVSLGAFTPTAEPVAEDRQGRLPAEGDLAVYVPATALFPGSARLDPNIENPYSGDAEAIAAGERHFAGFNCAGCHAPLGGGGMGPPLSDEEWIYGSDPAQIFLSIMHGRPEGMPAWSSMLPRRTVWELVAYIETLDDIDNYATKIGFDAEHAFSTNLERRTASAADEQERETSP